MERLLIESAARAERELFDYGKAAAPDWPIPGADVPDELGLYTRSSLSLGTWEAAGGRMQLA
jgi:hypothetical protein